MELSSYRRLRDMREDRDLTQQQVGEYLGITKQQYFLYEKGYREIPSSMLGMLADFYGTRVDYLMGRTEDPAPPSKPEK